MIRVSIRLIDRLNNCVTGVCGGVSHLQINDVMTYSSRAATTTSPHPNNNHYVVTGLNTIQISYYSIFKWPVM